MKYLNEILIEWNNSEIEDNGIIKSDDVKDSFKGRGFIVNGVKFNMIKVPDQDYYIGETLVTQELWQAVMGDNPSKHKGLQNPVSDISVEECKIFIQALNKITGIKFHLPTVQEWENSLGDEFKKLFRLYKSNRNDSRWDRYNSTDLDTEYNKLEEFKYIWAKENSGEISHYPVKTKLPNEYGIYDLIGNVWEYCEDSLNQYSGPIFDGIVGKGYSTRITIWQIVWSHCWEACASPLSNRASIGFRLALSI